MKESRGNAPIYGTAASLAVLGFVNPIPLADALYIIPGWAAMLAMVASSFEIEFNIDSFKTLMGQIVGGMWAYMIGVGVFTTVVKWTGIGTLPAAMVNAALNFGFTVALGKLYQLSWAEGRDPSRDQIESELRSVAGKVKSMDKEVRRKLKEDYEALRARGVSQKDALFQVLAKYFDVEE